MGTREQVEKWADTPEEERQPPTQKELALILGVSEPRITALLAKRRKRQISKDNGDFDLKKYLRGNMKDIATALVGIINTGKNTKSIELALKTLGELVEKREDTHKFEFTPNDYTRIARETINGLRQEFIQLGGMCPVCGQLQEVRHQARLDTEPEQPEGGEVATLALPARPD